MINVDMLKKEKLIELSKVAERTEQSEKEKCEHQNVLNKNRISLIKLREATLTKSIKNIESLHSESQVKLNDTLN
ncbi:hypothetical protein FS593_22305 (plasmid) [Lelliottia amnigena]|uniref:hypothetical protein n=1 Tax=Lelliottia amnigena TaxID=61646 RepID=UPI001F3C5426|nr:hypothetical protein [Lelliottia amnigena]UJD97036.1 hypothetical protein FS593_22305 [Lelliottia amnigena]